ncbi:hypothetical protein LIER_01647 [Lithospermum erythrorhizon]|uniref:SNRNP25 ubiquitin-like domain-containing protein n=1 Tax=Lithospermum erythrorhizon TaxID=34254 RepID=A0AAV3NMD5_LITER
MQIMQGANFGCRSNYKVFQFHKNHGFSPNRFTIPFSQMLRIDTLSRKSFSYNKVPQEPLKLTVLKLDGTYFDIEVAKNGTVAELKQAVEVAFSHLPQSGPGKVSWSHVWDHFCLSYNGYKLLNDNDFIGCYEIKDDDQLQFIRHVSINYMERTRAKRDGLILDKRNLEQNGGNNQIHESRIKCCEINDKDGHDRGREDENVYDSIKGEEHKSLVTSRKHKFAHLFRGWFSYCKLKETNIRMKQTRNSSKCSRNYVRNFRNILRLYTNKEI